MSLAIGVASATGSHALSSPFFMFNSQFHHGVSLHFPTPFSFFLIPRSRIFLKSRWAQHYDARLLLGRPQSSLSRKSREISSDHYDPELRSVLELATDSELYELEKILFGPSYFSPLLKSITKRADIDYVMVREDMDEREDYISMLESRFLFLAADARSTLRGWRPSYKAVLLDVRKKLNIPCSSKLSTEDLEAEIFLHMVQDYSREEAKENVNTSDGLGSLEHGLSQWKIQAAAAVSGAAEELGPVIMKSGGMLTLGKVYELLAGRLSGKMFQEAAKYRIKNELIKKGGQLAAINLESQVALLAAKQGVVGAASRYLGLRSMMTLLGPMLWGTLLADVVIQMLGTDYARIMRAIYAFAQIRILRTYKSPSNIG